MQNEAEAARLESQIEGFKSYARFTASDAAEWMLWGVESNDHRILVGYDAWAFDLVARLAPRYNVVVGLRLQG